MCVDTGMKFSMDVGHRKSYRENFLYFMGTGIGMPTYPGNNIFVKLGHLKFGQTEKFWENARSIVPKLPWPVVSRVLVSSSSINWSKVPSCFEVPPLPVLKLSVARLARQSYFLH